MRNKKNIIKASSAQLSELEWYVGNKEVHLLRYYEPEPGIFIAESKNVIDIALRKGYEPLSVVCTEKMEKDEILDRVGEAPIYIVDPEDAKREFGYVLTGGISCAMRRKENFDYKKVLENVQTEIISNMAVTETIKNSTVTDEEVEAYYEENKDRFVSAPTASAKHILVDTEDKCNEVLAEINAGTKTFEDAAKEYSTCPSKERGGDLGTFGKGQMVPEFDAAVFGAEVGKVLGPVKTQFGYHLIRVEELHQAETQPFESVKDQIRQSLVQAAQKKTYSEKVAELEGKYGVTRN